MTPAGFGLTVITVAAVMFGLSRLTVAVVDLRREPVAAHGQPAVRELPPTTEAATVGRHRVGVAIGTAAQRTAAVGRGATKTTGPARATPGQGKPLRIGISAGSNLIGAADLRGWRPV